MVSINDIFNRPPAISEDTLQYTLYLPPDQTDRVSATTLATLLTDHAQSLLPQHMWHRDAFELKVAPDPEGRKDVWVLEGRMRVGDCIDDEWCTVWLLRELSQKWDVVISVFDSDGEFLLIEAADQLPSWVTPANAENRVWIYNSRLHLVPLSHVSPPSSKTHRRQYLPRGEGSDEDDLGNDEHGSEFITAADAVKFVRDPLVETAASWDVQEVVWRRISGYPVASRQHLHITKAYLPVDVAKALAINPQLVQKAVEAFYTRDAIQLRAAQKMARFSPEPVVLSSVKMTRTAYAQLLGQRFHPPKVFGRWVERDGTREWLWRDVGMKIACGFEMLYQESKNRKDTVNFDGSIASAEALKDNLRRNSEYTQYIQHLSAAGYFRGEVKDSQLWTTLENQAASAFIGARREDDASRPSFATAVEAAVTQYVDDNGLPQEDEDEDSWLNVDAADFESMLAPLSDEKGKHKAPSADTMNHDEEHVAKIQAARLRELAMKVEEFVEGEGDIEGVRFADEAVSSGDSDNDDTDVDREIDMDNEEEDGMDQDVPTQTLDDDLLEERAARQQAMERLVPGIDPSEYGRMPPSFYSNSQRVTPVTIRTEGREEIRAGGAIHSPSSVRPIRPPILPRDNYDGVDSDDNSTEEGDIMDEDEEDQPQVVGEVEIDMAGEEEEFIEFARHALGIGDDQWNEIIRDRKRRGVFVPTVGTSADQGRVVTATVTQHEPLGNALAPLGGSSHRLDSFDSLMKAMDAQLAQLREQGHPECAAQITTSKGGKEGSGDGFDRMGIETVIGAESEEALGKRDSEGEDDGSNEEPGGADYQLIKNFLESFKSQGGLSGPVSTLVGRLQQGWTLPRDES